MASMPIFTNLSEECLTQVLAFVTDAVQAESFNPSTLFLFGYYTIGKERLFLEVARILNRKVIHLPSLIHTSYMFGLCFGSEFLEFLTLLCSFLLH